MPPFLPVIPARAHLKAPGGSRARPSLRAEGRGRWAEHRGFSHPALPPRPARPSFAGSVLQQEREGGVSPFLSPDRCFWTRSRLDCSPPQDQNRSRHGSKNRSNHRRSSPSLPRARSVFFFPPPLQLSSRSRVGKWANPGEHAVLPHRRSAGLEPGGNVRSAQTLRGARGDVLRGVSVPSVPRKLSLETVES